MLENIINNQHNLRLISFYIVVITGIILIILALFIYIKYFFSLINKEKNSPPKQFIYDDFRGNISLILNMLGRKVEVFKIAQTIRQISNHQFDEDEILQTILSIKEFIEICNSSYSKNLNELENKISIKQILENLYDGNPYLSLVFLNLVINKNIQTLVKFENIKNVEIKNNISVLTYIYGNIAKIFDKNLAKNSFELSIQLNPENFASWSRLADTKKELKDIFEASKIYKMIIEKANEKEFPNAVVNSHKKLFEIFEPNNDEYHGFHHYYDSIGINTPLISEDIQALEIINKQANKQAIITMLIKKDTF